jgi:hypothetical protein
MTQSRGSSALLLHNNINTSLLHIKSIPQSITKNSEREREREREIESRRVDKSETSWEK